MLKALYVLASVMETGLGIHIFGQMFPKRIHITGKQVFSQCLLFTIVMIGLYNFPKAFGIVKNAKEYIQILIIIYCSILCIYVTCRLLMKQERLISNVFLLLLFMGMIIWISWQYWVSYLSTNVIALGNILPVLFVFSYYQCTIFQAYLWEFLYLTNLGLIKAVFVTYAGNMRGKYFQEFFLFPRNHTYSEIIYLLIVFTALYFCVKNVPVGEIIKKTLNIHRKKLFMMALCEWILLSILTKLGIGEISKRSFMVTLAVTIGITLGLFVLYVRSLIKSMDIEKRFLDERDTAMNYQYKELREAYEKYRCLIHDEKHMISYLQECFNENDYENAAKFLKSYQENVFSQGNCCWTGIPTLDFMLNIKKRKMDELLVEFSCNIEIEEIPFEETDFVVILGNLLDNAIEAVEKCEASDRQIYLSMQCVNEMFILKIKNRSIAKPNVKNNRFITDKEEKNNHGWGIESIKRVVDKYSGGIKFQYDENFFQTAIIINYK